MFSVSEGKIARQNPNLLHLLGPRRRKMISAASQGEFLDDFYAEVLGDLLRLSKLASLPSEQQRALAESDSELDERMHFLKSFQLCQRPATLEELGQYLELLGIDSSAVPSNRLEALSALMHYCKDISACLALGGDDRLTVNPDAYNQSKYLASVFPRSDILRRGSCTCSTVNPEGFAVAEKAMGDLWDTPLAMMNMGGGNDLSATVRRRMDECQQKLMQRLKKVLHISDAGVVLFPSGSDAEFFPLLLATIRSEALGCEAHVLNYVTAAGEVGSGTVHAATGQHFSVLAPNGSSVAMGATAINVPSVTTIQYKPRGADGSVCGDDRLLIDDVRQRLLADASAVAILHVVVGSKTGLRQPSQATVHTLTQEFGRRILPVVDACQFRTHLAHIRHALHRGEICLVTASKFFAAPPFAGAVLLPTGLVAELESYFSRPDPRWLPTGLRDYLSPMEASAELQHLRNFLWQPSRERQWMNVGLHLRWQIGLDMMERYARLETDLVAEFARCYLQRLRNEMEIHCAPFVVLWEDRGQAYGDFVGETNSIVSFTVRVREGPGWRDLSATEAKDFHRLLTLHYSTHASLQTSLLSEREADQAVSVFNACKVMLGQPVKVTEDGGHVLRIALGADMVVAALADPSSLCPPATPLSDRMAALRWAFLSYASDWEGRAHLSAQDLLAYHRLRALPWVQALCTRVHSLLHEDDLMLDKMYTLACHWFDWDRTRFEHTTTLSSRGMHSPHPGRPHTTRSVPPPASSPSPRPALDASLLPDLMCTLRARGLLPRSLVAYDGNALDGAVAQLREAFAPLREGFEVEHCCAVKSCPLVAIQSSMIARGLGCECASLCEVRLALQAGCLPHRVVYDSPCKSVADLTFALVQGVTVNCNSYHEVYLVHSILQGSGMQSSSRVGLRLNPLVGGGAIAALSTATLTSKFGVPLLSAATARLAASRTDVDMHTEAVCEGDGRQGLQEMVQEWMGDPRVHMVLACYEMFPFLTGVMVHVGSQGMAVQTMATGVQRALLAADLVDRVCSGGLPVDLSAAREKHRQEMRGLCPPDGRTSPAAPSSKPAFVRRIAFVDIGGGLSVNYASNEITPTAADYVHAIREVCAPLLTASPASWWPTAEGVQMPPPRRRVLVTEFGKALVAKTAVVLTQVEDVLVHEDVGESGGLHTAIVHSGADVFLRTAYAREKFPHRVSLLRETDFCPVVPLRGDGGGGGYTELASRDKVREAREAGPGNVVGPLCFSGDVIAEGVLMPRVRRGDYLVVLDAGANTLSMFSRHCSRPSPAVVLFRRVVVQLCGGEEEAVLLIDKIRCEESSEQVAAFWK